MNIYETLDRYTQQTSPDLPVAFSGKRTGRYLGFDLSGQYGIAVKSGLICHHELDTQPRWVRRRALLHTRPDFGDDLCLFSVALLPKPHFLQQDRIGFQKIIMHFLSQLL